MTILHFPPIPRPVVSARLARISIRSYTYDHVVIGAGVVGLAVAAKLSEYPVT